VTQTDNSIKVDEQKPRASVSSNNATGSVDNATGTVNNATGTLNKATGTLKRINADDIHSMDQRQRVHFINSLSGYKSANIIGTQNQNGATNACIVSSVIHLGADPALIAFINRPHTAERNTLDNIYQTGVYTVNHVNSTIFEDAHHTSARYPAAISEFDQTSLCEYYTDFAAPYVQQSRIKMGVEFRQKIDIELNGTVMIIGEIVEVLLEPELIADDGKIDVVAAKTVAVSGLDEYHIATSLGRLEYAKPRE
jgi:flavin reductase (DIM6/NTAB) family NADH-FMN oxidoreductase RutF